MLCLATESCPTLCNAMDCSPLGSSVHGDSPGKNTGLGCHALLQGWIHIFNHKIKGIIIEVGSRSVEDRTVETDEVEEDFRETSNR